MKSCLKDIILTTILVAATGLPRMANAQIFSLRNNLLYDVTLSPNLGLEIRQDSFVYYGVNAGLNLWDADKTKNKKWRHVMVAPYLRHYNDTTLSRSFWGLHAVYSHYNVGGVRFPLDFYKGVRDSRLQGDLVALGGSYGYSWHLAGPLHLEAELGLALGYTWYKEYDCPTCGAYRGSDNKLLLLPKMGLNLVWAFGRRMAQPAEPEVVMPPVVQPQVIMAIHNVADNTGTAGILQEDNPVLEHISRYRPYDRTRILRREPGALYVHFPVGKAELQHDYRDNAVTLDRIVSITRQIMADSTSQVKRIQLIGLASIEGPVAQNERLANDRAQALKEYLQQRVATPDTLYDAVGGGEAWADFRDQLEELASSVAGGSPTGTAASASSSFASSVAGGSPAGTASTAPAGVDLRGALAIIDSEPDADRREQRLRQLGGGRTWQYIKDNVLADQRNSGYIRIYYDYVPDSAAAVINRASDLLRTDCPDCHRQALALLQTVSTDERAQNALATALYLCGRRQEAIDVFRRAAANGSKDAQENLRNIEH